MAMTECDVVRNSEYVPGPYDCQFSIDGYRGETLSVHLADISSKDGLARVIDMPEKELQRLQSGLGSFP